MSIKKHITLQNKLSELEVLAAAVEVFAEQAALDMKTQFNLNLALDELVTNIIHYAYDDEGLHQIEITLSYGDYLLNVQMQDDGKPFDPTGIEGPEFGKDLEQREIGGLGIHFVRQLMDKMSYCRVGEQNHLILEKEVSGSE